MKYNIYDVAKRAGVSISTVSRVINNSAGVKESKMMAIKEAMEYYDYQPSQFGRGLAKQTSGLIGVYSPFLGTTMFSNGYILECLRGIDKAICGSGAYSLVLINEVEAYYKHDDGKPRFWDYVKQNKIDGLIVISLVSDTRLELSLTNIMEEGFPVGYIGQKFHESGLNVYAQYETYMYSMAEKYYMAGHKKIVALVDKHKFQTMLSVKASIEEKYEGLSLTPFVLERASLTVKALMGILEDYIKKEKCTGIICSSSGDAAKAINALKMLNLDIPEDISLMAVEHAAGEGAMLFPQISCYYVPAMQMGEDIAKKVISTLQEKEVKERSKNILPKYLDRGSVKILV